MKKTNLLLLTLAAGLLLAGCTTQPTKPSSSQETSSEVSSSSSESSKSETSSSDTSSSDTSSTVSSSESSVVNSSSSSLVEQFINQTAWTAEDNKLIKDNVGDGISLPYLPNYEYICEESPTYYDDVSFSIRTTADEYAKYITALKSAFTYDGSEVDEDGDTWQYFTIDETNCFYIDIVGYETQGNFIVLMDVYYYNEDDSGSDTPDIPDTDVDGIEISFDTIGSVLDAEIAKSSSSTYPSGNVNYTIDGVGFTSNSGFGLSPQDNGFDYYTLGAMQLKKSSGKIWNTTAFSEGVTTVYVNLLSTYDYDVKYTPKVYGGSSVSASTYTATVEKTDEYDTGYTFGANNYAINCFELKYTFDQPVTFLTLENNTTAAEYIYDIVIGTSGSTTPVDPVIPEDDGTGYKVVDTTKATVKNITEIGDYLDGMPTTGTPKVLVIPVDFSNATAESKGYTIENLNKAFNGNSSELDYYSVHDYFYQSSYEQLDINFDIYPSWVRAPKTLEEYQAMAAPTDINGYTGNDSYATNEQLILNYCLDYLDKQGVDLSQYDSDKNGTIDSVVLINAADIVQSEEQDNLAWAFRYWNMLGDTNNVDSVYGGYEYYTYDGVYANDYLWASYQFLFEGSDGQFNHKDNLNTYTFIHEFSHVLGSDDYYDTSYVNHPLGGFDVMDAATADHNAYTKLVYGWITNSKLITASESVTLSLNDFETSGESIIIANNWDDKYGAFQEYWILTYYTNNGLNTKTGGLFDDEGIVVYHVNSSITYDSTYEAWYIDYTNSSDRTNKHKLISFVKNGSNYVYGVNDTLSKTIKDDNGNVIPYTFKVDSKTASQVTLTFTKNA